VTMTSASAASDGTSSAASANHTADGSVTTTGTRGAGEDEAASLRIAPHSLVASHG
jgi:hypothetical protein